MPRDADSGAEHYEDQGEWLQQLRYRMARVVHTDLAPAEAVRCTQPWCMDAA